MGRASRAERDQRARDVQTALPRWPVLAGWDRDRDRDRRLTEEAGRRWSGDAVPALLPAWPEDSLGDRLLSDQLCRAALDVPPLEHAGVPDRAAIRSDPVQWNVAPVVEAEPAAYEVPAAGARSDGLEPGAVRPEFPDEDGPVFLIGCCGLVHATWTATSDDPFAAVIEVVASLLGDTVPDRSRVEAETLVRALSERYARERASDVELLERLGVEMSGDPLRDLVSAGVVAPHDVLRVDLVLLGALAERCMTSSFSVLEGVAAGTGSP